MVRESTVIVLVQKTERFHISNSHSNYGDGVCLYGLWGVLTSWSRHIASSRRHTVDVEAAACLFGCRFVQRGAVQCEHQTSICYMRSSVTATEQAARVTLPLSHDIAIVTITRSTALILTLPSSGEDVTENHCSHRARAQRPNTASDIQRPNKASEHCVGMQRPNAAPGAARFSRSQKCFVNKLY